MFFKKLKTIILKGIYIFLGISLFIIPYAVVYMGYLYKGGDTDFLGGLILFIIEIFLLTLPILLIDILVFGFLLKINLKNLTLLKMGSGAGLILIVAMLLMENL